MEEYDWQHYIGLSKEDADALAAENGCVTRVVEEDGVSYIVTMDYRFDRVNLRIENGRVYAATIG